MTDAATTAAGVNIPETNPIAAPSGVINNTNNNINNNNNRPRPVVSSPTNNYLYLLFLIERFVIYFVLCTGSLNKCQR